MSEASPHVRSSPAVRARRRVRSILRKLPRRSNAATYPILRHLAPLLAHRRYLWSWKYPEVRRAYYIGWIVTLMPLFGTQILASTALSIIFKANVTVASGLQFVSNPLSAAPIIFVTYQVGKILLTSVGFVPTGLIAGTTIFLFAGGLITGLACAVITDGTHSFLRARRRARSTPIQG